LLRCAAQLGLSGQCDRAIAADRKFRRIYEEAGILHQQIERRPLAQSGRKIEMPKIQVGEVSLNYDVAGKGEPILMIMGLGASSAAWDPGLVAELARTFRVITFDNRGTGQSDKPDAPYSIEMFADDAAGLLGKLEVPRAHIFGVSMGGMIA